ncbi:hypothetical protein DFW92_08550 [Campylobacter coli]|nr:hypothetical protein [Campylobacter coli]
MKPYLYSLIEFIKEEINVIPKESANTSICQNILHKVVFISISLYNKGYFDDESKIKEIIDNNKEILDKANKEIIIKESIEEQKIISSLHSVFNYLYKKIVLFRRNNNTTLKPTIIEATLKEKFTKEICG